jgi:hypothetical protein
MYVPQLIANIHIQKVCFVVFFWLKLVHPIFDNKLTGNTYQKADVHPSHLTHERGALAT